jgi:hypothetical protein
MNVPKVRDVSMPPKSFEKREPAQASLRFKENMAALYR